MCNQLSLEKPIFLRSYGKRKGRKISPAQEQYMHTILSRFLLHDSHEIPNLHQKERATSPKKKIWPGETSTAQKKILEIGFGSGEHLRYRLREDATCLYLASEVYWNGIASCLAEMVKEGLVANFQDRLKIYPDDLRLLLPFMADGEFDEVSILFPDPWPKKRHQKRRLLQQHFLDEVARILKPDGELRIASDHVGLMAWMIEQLMENSHYVCEHVLATEGELPKTLLEFPEGWQMTRYQKKAWNAGRSSYFMSVKRAKKAELMDRANIKKA